VLRGSGQPDHAFASFSTRYEITTSIQQLTGIAFAALNNMIDFSAGEEDPLERAARLTEDNRGCFNKYNDAGSSELGWKR
jgi:hypothetical protein